jgi:peptide chain release factor 2
MTTTEQIKGIVERLGALREVLDANLIEISNEEEKTVPDFGTSAFNPQKISKTKKMD